jgi:hypothetical protein
LVTRFKGNESSGFRALLGENGYDPRADCERGFFENGEVADLESKAAEYRLDERNTEAEWMIGTPIANMRDYVRTDGLGYRISRTSFPPEMVTRIFAELRF